MTVYIQQVKAKDLQTKIQEAKDNGLRILALSPAALKTLKTGVVVTTYTLVTQ